MKKATILIRIAPHQAGVYSFSGNFYPCAVYFSFLPGYFLPAPFIKRVQKAKSGWIHPARETAGY